MSRRRFMEWVGVSGLSALVSCSRMKGAGRSVGLGRNGKLTFAAVNDVHVLDARSVAIVNRAMDQINEDERVRFTVVLGDIATDGELEELRLAKTAFERLDQPYFTVPGNHDVFVRSKTPLGNYEQVFGEREWIVEEAGWVFLGLNSCEGSKSDVSIQPDSIQWLKKRLKKVGPNRPIALFAHHPFNPNTKSYRVINAEEVLGLFDEHNLRLVATGHYHGNQVEESDGVLFTTTACCASTRGNFDKTPAKGYRLFHLDGETVTSEFVEVPE